MLASTHRAQKKKKNPQEPPDPSLEALRRVRDRLPGPTALDRPIAAFTLCAQLIGLPTTVLVGPDRPGTRANSVAKTAFHFAVRLIVHERSFSTPHNVTGPDGSRLGAPVFRKACAGPGHAHRGWCRGPNRLIDALRFCDDLLLLCIGTVPCISELLF